MKDELTKLPKHIAFIIDGNGRWAKARGLPRSLGHDVGIKNLDVILKECFYNYNIPVVSIYAFSTENWNRPKAEIDFLIKSFRKYLSKSFVEKFPEVKLNIMGDYTKFPQDLVDNADKTIEDTKNNTKYILNLGINYSGQDELVYAVNKILKQDLKNVDRQTIEQNLYTAGQIPLDFCIRTSGEQRLSNFMLWQIAYSELYFPKTYWPSFGKKELYLALQEYGKRNRRFGAIKEEK